MHAAFAAVAGMVTLCKTVKTLQLVQQTTYKACDDRTIVPLLWVVLARAMMGLL